MADTHYNIRVNIEEVQTEGVDNALRNQGILGPKRLVQPIEIKVTAGSLEQAVRKVKGYLDIELETN